MAEFELDLIHESLVDHQKAEVRFPHLIPQNILVEKILTGGRIDAEVGKQNQISEPKEIGQKAF